MPFKELFKPVHLKFLGKKELAPGIYCFIFDPGKRLKWAAGQHGIIAIRDKHNPKKTIKRSYSIASAPEEKIISITTRISPDKVDKFKTAIYGLKKGEQVSLRGPIGKMQIRDFTKNYAFLANGVSIAPFRAILKQLSLSDQKDTKITVYYSGSKNNHIFKDDLAEFKSALKHLSIHYIFKPNRITGQLIEDTLGAELYNTTFFLSGPPKILHGYRRTLLGLGVSKKDIIRSRYMDYRSRLAIMLPLKNKQPVSMDI